MVDDVERGQVGELLPGNEKQGVGKINKLKIEIIIMISCRCSLTISVISVLLLVWQYHKLDYYIGKCI